MSRLILWGAGGHGKVVLDIALNTGFNHIAFLDGDRSRAGSTFCGYEILGDSIEELDGSNFVVAVGSNLARARCYERGLSAGLTPLTLIHKAATVSPSARVGAGCVIMAGAVVNAEAQIGENCIINTGAIIEHDCRVSDHVHISPRTALGGAVRIGRYAHVGIGATLLPGAVVGEGSIIGAGAVVLKSVPAGSTAVGVPARILVRST